MGIFGITVLGSGSSGNATVIHGPEGDLLIDAGFSAKELNARFVAAGLDASKVKALLITHEHSDHVKGCKTFAEKLGIPIYLTRKTLLALEQSGRAGGLRNLFAPGSSFALCGLDVAPFSIQHDASDPVAFTFQFDGLKIGVATDLGAMNMLGLQRLKGCAALVLESNHDLEMLRNSQRPLHTKRRIMGRMGHLNNLDAMQALEEIVSDPCRCLILAHLSRECNDPDLVANLARERLAKLRRDDILLLVAEQGKPTQTVWLR